MILLIHETDTDARIVLSEGKVAGEQTPARLYEAEGKYVTIDEAPHVQAHDVAELLKLGYRLASPSEQEEYAAKSKKSGRLRERGDN